MTKDKPRENLKAAFSAAATFGMPPVISAYEFGCASYTHTQPTDVRKEARTQTHSHMLRHVHACVRTPPDVAAPREGVDELAVIIWLCVWLDLMDPARKAFFEPLPVVPVSQRVLMDKLMVRLPCVV